MTYSRPVYVVVLGLAVTALILAAEFGGGTEATLAYVVAFGLGSVAFYQGEARVTPGPIVANVGIALAVGSVAALLTIAAMFIGLVNAPWDIALWQSGVRVWPETVGIVFVFTTSFFVVGAVGSLT